jgi:hypothetical protein
MSGTFGQEVRVVFDGQAFGQEYRAGGGQTRRLRPAAQVVLVQEGRDRAARDRGTSGPVHSEGRPAMTGRTDNVGCAVAGSSATSSRPAPLDCGPDRSGQSV